MVFRECKAAAERFARYVGEPVGVIGHADRAGPLRDYCTGLMLPERKSVEPMAVWRNSRNAATAVDMPLRLDNADCCGTAAPRRSRATL
jgi:SRSO17 transposase